MDNYKIIQGDEGSLGLSREGDQRSVPVRPIQYFPVTHPEEFWGLFLREPSGSAGKEILSIASPHELDTASRILLERELGKSFTKSCILKIYSIRLKGKGFLWIVETEKGRQGLEITNQQSVNLILGRYVLLRDAQGMRYLIDLEKMDPASRGLLDVVI